MSRHRSSACWRRRYVDLDVLRLTGPNEVETDALPDHIFIEDALQLSRRTHDLTRH
jgi:hypothetical protein